jgi:hypothetical protein
MAWHDDREGVGAKRPADGPRRSRLVDPFRDFAISERRSRRNRACHLIDPAIKIREPVDIEPHPGKVD